MLVSWLGSFFPIQTGYYMGNLLGNARIVNFQLHHIVHDGAAAESKRHRICSATKHGGRESNDFVLVVTAPQNSAPITGAAVSALVRANRIIVDQHLKS